MKKKTPIEKIIFWIGTPSSLFVHSVFFIFMCSLILFGFSSTDVLLILTTIVSLEAIYLSIFIQMSVNRQGIENEETRQVLSSGLSNLQETMDEVSETMDEVSEMVEEVVEEVVEEFDENNLEKK
jgi:hydrogenase maturation factor